MGSGSATRRSQRAQHAPGKIWIRPHTSAPADRTQRGRVRRRCVYQDELKRPVFRGPTATDSTATVSSEAGQEDHIAALVESRVHAELQAQIGTREQLHTAIGNYFSTVHQRVTIICKKRFLDRLVSFNTVPADFAALCLAMNLVIRQPSVPPASMLLPTYANLKSLIGLLEASEYLTLEVVQCRILCATYEFGHGNLVAASMSVAACAKLARLIQLQPRRQGLSPYDFAKVEDEERSRAWWALANLER
jgi:hypothetical protein